MIEMTDVQSVPSSEFAPRRRGEAPPPAILLGGGANALSVARSLGRLGVAVYALEDPGTFVRYSRYCRRLDAAPSPDDDGEETWPRFLLGPGSDHLRGAVLLACSDAGIITIASHREALAARFRLDESYVPAQLGMLDKLATYEAARAAGVPTPRFWVAESRDQVEALRDELAFPLLVKPRISHRYEGRFGKKFVVANDFDELIGAFAAASSAGVDALLVELIPGPDDRLCSYYTYLDADGRALFHFTKRIIRRYPIGMGSGCYHITDHASDLAEPSLRLCRQMGLRGLANVEYKRDPRDGSLKLIECNARFTASNCLVARSGFDLAAFVYNRIVGRPQRPLEHYVGGMRLWDPARDFACFLELRRRGDLSFAEWLRGVLHRQTFPYFQWSDPWPSLVRISKPLRDRLGRRGSRG